MHTPVHIDIDSLAVPPQDSSSIEIRGAVREGELSGEPANVRSRPVRSLRIHLSSEPSLTNSLAVVLRDIRPTRFVLVLHGDLAHSRSDAEGRPIADAARPLPEPTTASILTSREAEIMSALCAGGTSNEAIANRLGLSPNTVKSHMQRIMAKAGVASRAELVAWAFRNHLVA